MNQDNVFCQISKNFKVDWNIDEVIKKINSYVVDDTNKIHQPLKNIEYPCYQKYPNGVIVSHNFPKFFQDECINVCDNLSKLQANIKDVDITSELFDYFKKVTFFDPIRVRIMECSHTIKPHTDLREYAINIGLKNSSNAITRISESKDSRNIDNVPFYQYQLNDGDVVLLNTHHAHWVDTIDKSLTRCIISYNLKI